MMNKIYDHLMSEHENPHLEKIHTSSQNHKETKWLWARF